MNKIIANIRHELSNIADPKVKESGERFFKEAVTLYGVKSHAVEKLSKEYFKQIPDKNKESIFPMCEELWQSGMMEESFVACHWSYALRKSFVPEDIILFERWINTYVSNWASCDTFCNHTVGTLIEMYPQQITHLKKWSVSKNRWMRRAAAVSLIVPAKKGLFLDDILEIANTMVLDKDDMVQKGYGWMLKVASQVHHQKAIFDFVMKHKATMPRTALRYAIEKMPRELRKCAMKK